MKYSRSSALFLFAMIPRPPISTLVPFTTVFRSAVGCAGAPEGLLRVGRTVRSGTGAALRLVALAERRATDEAARLEAVERTVVVVSVAVISHVANSGGGSTDKDILVVVRAGRGV